MLLRIIVSIGILSLLSGCAVNRTMDHKQQLSELKQSYSQFDMKLRWNVVSSDSVTHIDGLIENVWATFMEDVEVWVMLLDKTLACTVDYIGTIRQNELTPFSLILPMRSESGSKLAFSYRYTPRDGSDTDKWMQSFETNVP
jgi:hypothetical protein